MRHLWKALLYLLILSLLDFALRKGFIGFLIPSPFSPGVSALLYFALFALCAWLLTMWFARFDGNSLNKIGVSWSRLNRYDFIWGFALGMVLWGLVSICQSYFAGFSWEVRPDFDPTTLIFGLLFIFIADLGTELFMRGYPLVKLEAGYGVLGAVAVMVMVEVMKSLIYPTSGDLWFYAAAIPVLHVVFFSFIYFITRRLGASLGVHTGANFVTISVFDLREEQVGQVIPPGVFQADTNLEALSMHAIQLPWIFMALVLCVATYLWWVNRGGTFSTDTAE